jgi:hypothetical protein
VWRLHNQKAGGCVNGFVAKFRAFFRRNDPGQYQSVADLFLRLLGVIYYAAFSSLWPQVRGLAGVNGILPARDYIHAAGAQLTGFARWHELPTLCWISAGDGSLTWQCALGALGSVLLIIGLAPRLLCVVLWILWLSLTVACRDFLGFQWENLLLETGFLAIFLAPWKWSLRSRVEPSRVVLWLLRWLLFRLMFLSGIVKLLSGDPSWRNFTALFYHYETQPLPTVFAWYSYHLPTWVLVLQTGIMYVIELGLPFLIFVGRRSRMVACIGFVLLQVTIALTGNYCYFNFLTILLCLLLLDDNALHRLTPKRWRKAPVAKPEEPEEVKLPTETKVPNTSAQLLLWRIRNGGLAVLTIIILLVSLPETLAACGLIHGLPSPLRGLFAFVEPFRSINNYGLFAVMTKSRPEIIVEGSNDGKEWKAYEFKYKPGNLASRPKFVAPHQPRLDWQMWFAALGTYQQNPWFINFCLRLLQGSPEVIHLLAGNPFPDKPPKYIRAVTYDYEFTDRATLRRTGQWWQRTYKGIYLPQVTLEAKSVRE